MCIAHQSVCPYDLNLEEEISYRFRQVKFEKQEKMSMGRLKLARPPTNLSHLSLIYGLKIVAFFIRNFTLLKFIFSSLSQINI